MKLTETTVKITTNKLGMIIGMHVGYIIKVIMRSNNPELYNDRKNILFHIL
jgi:hypothetical protein